MLIASSRQLSKRSFIHRHGKVENLNREREPLAANDKKYKIIVKSFRYASQNEIKLYGRQRGEEETTREFEGRRNFLIHAPSALAAENSRDYRGRSPLSSFVRFVPRFRGALTPTKLAFASYNGSLLTRRIVFAAHPQHYRARARAHVCTRQTENGRIAHASLPRSVNINHIPPRR